MAKIIPSEASPALLDATYDWLQAIDNGKEVCAIFFDLRKAFNSVPHRSLLEKLKSTGLNEHLLKWIYSYLHGREQYVVLNGERSCTKPVLSGVPQGSVLGPLLFLIYINDATSESLDSNSKIILYADDILLHRVITSPSDYVALQNDVNTLFNWVEVNNLTLNAAKCKFMIISRLRKYSVPVPPITLHGQPLERVHCYKYLGVNISDDLSWTAHINEISSKARKLIGLLYRQFSTYSAPETLLQLYISLVRPHLEYASQIWSPHLIKHVNQLEQVQKFALKVCFRQWSRLSSYSDLLQLSNLPQLTERRKFLNLCYLFKLVNKAIDFPNCPLTPRNLNYPNRQGRTSLFVQPYASSNSFLHSFFPSTLSHWNSLPQSIVSSSSLCTFKRLLYENYYSLALS